MNLFNQYEVLIAAILYLAALLLYSPAPWYRSWTGRVLWTLLLSITLITALVSLSTFLGDFPLRPLFRDVTYTLVLINSVLILISIIAALSNGGRHGRASRKRDSYFDDEV